MSELEVKAASGANHTIVSSDIIEFTFASASRVVYSLIFVFFFRIVSFIFCGSVELFRWIILTQLTTSLNDKFYSAVIRVSVNLQWLRRLCSQSCWHWTNRWVRFASDRRAEQIQDDFVQCLIFQSRLLVMMVRLRRRRLLPTLDPNDPCFADDLPCKSANEKNI